MTKRIGVFRCGRRSAILANSAGPWAWTRGSQTRPPQREFSTLVPWEFLRRMRPGDPTDPLLLQVLPRSAEQDTAAGFSPDPVGEHSGHGLLQKYAGRALLVVNSVCAAHCRYCFRRHFPYDNVGPSQWQQALLELRESHDVEELILSGGDPLTLSDERFKQLCQAAAAIPQLKRLRIHSRLPILIPARVTASLLRLLTDLRLSVWMVVHVNHPQEIDDSVAEALTAFRQAGIPVLNQSVLMRDVNDSSETLIELSRRLVNLGVLPYYIHQLDRVQGAHHFEVAEVRGRQIVRELRSRLPGYAVPRYVREVAGEPSKVGLD